MRNHSVRKEVIHNSRGNVSGMRSIRNHPLFCFNLLGYLEGAMLCDIG